MHEFAADGAEYSEVAPVKTNVSIREVCEKFRWLNTL